MGLVTTTMLSQIPTQVDHFYIVRASTSVHGQSCKIQKAALFTHFDQKKAHISGCKIVQNCA